AGEKCVGQTGHAAERAAEQHALPVAQGEPLPREVEPTRRVVEAEGDDQGHGQEQVGECEHGVEAEQVAPYEGTGSLTRRRRLGGWSGGGGGDRVGHATRSSVPVART